MTEVYFIGIHEISLSCLLQKVLGKSPEFPEITTGDWMELFKISSKQAVVGICFYAIDKLFSEGSDVVVNLPYELKLKWIAAASNIQNRNELVNRRCIELQTRLAEDGFRTYIMKGQGNAALYGSDLCLLRQSGDIDIFLDGGYSRVVEYVRRTCPTNEVNELEIHYHCFDDAEVEIHYRPFIMRNPFKNAIFQRFLSSEGRKSFDNYIELPDDAGHIAVPTSAFNVVHQLVHIFHHFFTEGIGLRQLLDYYFVLSDVSKKQEDVSGAVEMIHRLGLDRFARALMWCLVRVFDADEKILLWSPDVVDGQVLFSEILRSGNFGQMNGINVKLSNKFKSFWYVNAKTFRFIRFDRWAWFWSPLWRVYHFAWRKVHGYD